MEISSQELARYVSLAQRRDHVSVSHKKTKPHIEMVRKAMRLDEITLGVGIDGERARMSPGPTTV